MSTSTQVVQNEIRILDQILLLDLSGIHLWTARKKLKSSMLEGKIPPATLASLGSMRVIDPQELKPFEKIKRRATALVESRGVKFLGGYAIPEAVIHELVADLNDLKAEFYQVKQDFVSRYDDLVSDWVNREWEKSEWREAIQASVAPKGVVENGLQFGFAVCRVSPDGDEQLGDLLEGQVRGLADELYGDIAREAEDLLSTGLATRGHVDQRTLNTFRRMGSKLQGLMFLSSDVRALAQYISDLLDSLPASGVVSGSEYSQVVVLTTALANEGSLRSLVKTLNRGADAESQQQAQPLPAETDASSTPGTTSKPKAKAAKPKSKRKAEGSSAPEQEDTQQQAPAAFWL